MFLASLSTKDSVEIQDQLYEQSFLPVKDKPITNGKAQEFDDDALSIIHNSGTLVLYK